MMNSKYVNHIIYFYSQLKWRLFLGLFLSLFVGLLDGVGIAMFLPLLSAIGGSNELSSESMGSLEFVADFMRNIGIGFSLNSMLFSILILFILKGIFKFLEGYYSAHIQQLFILKIRVLCIERLTDFSYSYFIKADSGRIQNTLSVEVSRVVGAYRSYMAAIQNFVFVLVYLVLAFTSNFQFSALLCVGGVISGVMFIGIHKKTKKASDSVTRNGHVYQGLLIQSVAFFKYLKSTGTMPSYSLKLKSSVNEIERNNRKIGIIQAFLDAVREPVVLFVIIVILYIQLTFFDGKMSLVILSLMFFYRAMNYLMVVQTQWNGYLGKFGSLDNMSDFLEELEVNKEQYGQIPYVGFNNKLELVNVNFKYNDNEIVLKNINLFFEKNKTYAFIGESGSGKSTLVSLLSGLMKIKEGEFLIDNENSSNIDLRTYQKKIGLITQDPVIFNDNIFNNVTLWAEPNEINKKKFWKAIEQAAIHDFVKSLDLQEQSPLGNNGVMVSGGQKQRLSIARELFKDVDVLIMDEATSALDSETENIIRENIDNLKGELTILIIAHRLSTIKNVDQIILMNNGEIVAKNSFDILINENEDFKRMVSLQELSLNSF